MTDFAALQQTFVEEMKHGGGGKAMQPGAGVAMNTDPLIFALLDALPYYTSPDWRSVHRSTLANALAASLPNDPIWYWADSNDMVMLTNNANDPIGYHDAFFGGLPVTDAAASTLKWTQVNTKLDSAWWARYSITVLSDAVDKYCNEVPPMNMQQLYIELFERNADLVSSGGFAISMLAVFMKGYAPTANVLAGIDTSWGTQAEQLNELVLQGRFDALNAALAIPGDTASAAAWFLYMLWTTFGALGWSNPSGRFAAYQAAGLDIPDEVGASQWQQYTGVHSFLTGADVDPAAIPAINAEFYDYDGVHVHPMGYSWSLCAQGRFAYWATQ